MRKSTVILLFIIGFILVFTISGVIAFEAISGNEPATDNTNAVDVPFESAGAPSLPEGGVTRVTPGINVSDAIVTHGDEEHNVMDASYMAETEPVVEEVEEKKEEKVTEKPTQKATEKPTEKKKAEKEPTEKKSEAVKPTEKATEKVTEKPTQKATEKATEKVTEKTTEKKAEEKEPEEKETQAPTEKPTEKPKLDPDTHYSDTGL